MKDNAKPELIAELSLIEPMAPGFYDGLPMERYHAGPELSSSGLSDLKLSEAHYLAGRKKPRRHEVIGTLTHMRTLERDLFESTVVAIEGHRGGDAVKKAVAKATAEGKFVCKPEEYANVVAMSDAIMAHPNAKLLFRGGVAERSFYWKDKDSGADCRCRPDYLIIGDHVVPSDIKYFSDLTDFELWRQIKKMKYHWQAAFYEDGLQHVLGRKTDPFAHVFVEEPRFPNDHIGVRVICIEDDLLDEAREEIKPLKEKFARARESGKWNSYPEEITTIGKWIFTR